MKAMTLVSRAVRMKINILWSVRNSSLILQQQAVCSTGNYRRLYFTGSIEGVIMNAGLLYMHLRRDHSGKLPKLGPSASGENAFSNENANLTHFQTLQKHVEQSGQMQSCSHVQVNASCSVSSNNNQSGEDPLIESNSPFGISAVTKENTATESVWVAQSDIVVGDRVVGKPLQLDYSFHQQITSEVHYHLHYPWIVVKEEDGINVLLLSRKRDRSVQRSVFFSLRGEEEIRVHGKPLSKSLLDKLLIWDMPEERKSWMNSCGPFVKRVMTVIKRLQSYEVCIGVDDLVFKPLWNLDESGYIDNNPYKELRYQETFRSHACQLLVETEKYLRRRCSHCIQTKIRFKHKLKSHKNSSASPTSANIHLDRNQMLHKLEAQQKQLRSRLGTIVKLKSELKRATSRTGFQITDNLSDELVRICMDYVEFHSSYTLATGK